MKLCILIIICLLVQIKFVKRIYVIILAEFTFYQRVLILDSVYFESNVDQDQRIKIQISWLLMKAAVQEFHKFSCRHRVNCNNQCKNVTELG